MGAGASASLQSELANASMADIQKVYSELSEDQKKKLEDALKIATASSWFLIKHDFKSPDDVAPWWKGVGELMGDAEKWTAMIKGTADAGFHNELFLPPSQEGPLYCLWEGKNGKTKEDMQKFIDTNELSPARTVTNTVMTIPNELGGGNLKSFFAADYVAPKETPHKNTWYLVEHGFKSKDDVGPWWEGMKKMMSDPAAWEKMVKDTDDLGFHCPFFMPMDAAGPMFCLWEGKEGKTKADMEEFINTNKLSPASSLSNTVFQIPNELNGGLPGHTFFK